MRRRTCSGNFRELLRKRFPAIMGDPTFAGLLATYIFGGRRDRWDEDLVLVPFTLIAKLAGKQRQAAARNFKALDYLLKFKEEFKRYGVKVSWLAPRFRQKQCRALYIGLPDDVKEATARELKLTVPLKERVFFISGLSWTKKRASQLAEEDRSERQEITVQMTAATMAVVDYHNALPQHAFTALIPRAEELKRKAMTLPTPGRRDQALRCLQGFIDSPKPCYHGVRRSARAYPEGAGLNTMPKEFRRALCPWVEFDLANTQLACVAKDWNCTPLLDFLRSGQDFWKEIMTWCGAPNIKSAVKPAVYGLCFGQRKTRCAAAMLEALSLEKVSRRHAIVERFFTHPLIGALLEARTRREAEIKRAGFAVTCLGERIRVTSHRPPHAVNAACAQAMELALLTPVYEMARTTTDFTVMLYLYDGVSLRFTRRRAQWERSIVKAVEEEAHRRGIPTQLQIAHDPDVGREQEATGTRPDQDDKDRNRADLGDGGSRVAGGVRFRSFGTGATSAKRRGGCGQMQPLTSPKRKSDTQAPAESAQRSKKVGKSNTITKRGLQPEDLRLINLPQEFWGAHHERVPGEVRGSVTKYLSVLPQMRKEGVGLLLIGDPGVGKTAIAALVAKQARAIGMSAYFARISDLREDIRNRQQFDGEKSMIHRCQEVDVLVLDDLSLSDVRDTMWFGVRQIEELVATRKGARRITVITTRMSTDAMRSDPVISSLLATAQGAMVPMRVVGPNLNEARMTSLKKMLGVTNGR